MSELNVYCMCLTYVWLQICAISNQLLTVKWLIPPPTQSKINKYSVKPTNTVARVGLTVIFIVLSKIIYH
mgnify:FL=1